MRRSAFEWFRARASARGRGHTAPGPSPYAGQEVREIKALSAEEIRGYLTGEGMGLAKAAELNGYPGPAHVLELAAELEMTSEQRAKTEAVLAAMHVKATSLGEALVEAERRLDQLFAAKTATSESVAAALDEIGALQAKVRGAHLEAHLAESEILTAAQSARYAQLRHYGSASANPEHAGPQPRSSPHMHH